MRKFRSMATSSLRRIGGLPITRGCGDMGSNRDEFASSIVRVLQERVGNRCSNPGCRCATSGPNFAPTKATRIGVAAHITAAATGGPRYDMSLSAEQRSSIENGIWLCQNCSKLVDSDPLTYPVEVLQSWKTLAENRARAELEGQLVETEEPQVEQGWLCPYCGSTVPHGRTVCLGCKAEVVYGATRLERENAGKSGAMFGGVLAGMAMIALPDWLHSSFAWDVHAGWGLGIWAVVFVVVSAGLVGVASIHYEEQKRLNANPRFFRNSVA